VLDDLVNTQDAGRFIDVMPSADVWTSLLAGRHRNPQSRWLANDIFDIDAMCVAVPYCDVVVADADAAHAVNSARLPSRLGTTVISRLEDLVEVLADLP
jgi:hypothetical protein